MALIYLQQQNAADPHLCMFLTSAFRSYLKKKSCHCEANACFAHWVVACAGPGYIRPHRHCFHLDLLDWFSSLWSCLTKSFWAVVGFHWFFFSFIWFHLFFKFISRCWVFQISCLRSRKVNSLISSHLNFSLSCRNHKNAIKICSLKTWMCLNPVGIECGHMHFWDR